MSSNTLIINARILNEETIVHGSVYIENDTIAQVLDYQAKPSDYGKNLQVIDAQNAYLLPGLIDDQVHFRQPGLTHKADIASESKAAVAGGITSFMEMPNTNPQTTSLEQLAAKFELGAQNSMANYSFYMGATNQNLEELQKIDPQKVCGIKIFMGSSTGNMLVDDALVLENIFSRAPILIATHCEDEATIKANTESFRQQYGENILPQHHPLIRNHQACLLSSQRAVELARRHNTRLHILHLSTAQETNLFSNSLPLQEKRITGEVCVHHLWFSDEDYPAKGNFIKWNPAIKGKNDREKLWESLLSGQLDVVATDHAPHLLEEKQKPYLNAPSGGPLVQHALQAMADAMMQRNLPMHLIARWMCHNPAIAFNVSKRGFIKPGYYADMVILNPNIPQTVATENIFYKCKWSPFEGHTFKSTPTHTFINGRLVYANGEFEQNYRGCSLEFNRK